MRLSKLGLLVFTVLGASSAWSAVITSYTQPFVGELPIFHRPAPAGDNTVTELSTIGTQFPFHSFTFTVPSTGSYVIRSVQSQFDGVIILYGNAGGGNPFNSASPLNNALFGDDDEEGTVCDSTTCSSRILDNGGVLTLNSGWTYVLVTTQFDPLDGFSIGEIDPLALDPEFTNTIETADIPEPGSVLLLSAGLGGLFLLRRRVA